MQTEKIPIIPITAMLMLTAIGCNNNENRRLAEMAERHSQRQAEQKHNRDPSPALGGRPVPRSTRIDPSARGPGAIGRRRQRGVHDEQANKHGVYVE